MKAHRWRVPTGLVALLSWAAAGCGPSQPLGDVEGTVRLNGKPLANVVVSFLPDPEKNTKGPRSGGVTDVQGRYRLQCDNQKSGAVVGWHRVVLEDPETDRPRQGQPVKKASRVAARYTTAGQTPLRKEVKTGSQTIDLELTSEP
jgi:hypothetical protein